MPTALLRDFVEKCPDRLLLHVQELGSVDSLGGRGNNISSATPQPRLRLIARAVARLPRVSRVIFHPPDECGREEDLAIVYAIQICAAHHLTSLVYVSKNLASRDWPGLLIGLLDRATSLSNLHLEECVLDDSFSGVLLKIASHSTLDTLTLNNCTLYNCASAAPLRLSSRQYHSAVDYVRCASS